jgi:hypothetical protein
MSSGKITGSQTLNEEIGGEWQQKAGINLKANSTDDHAAPNAAFTAHASKNDVALKTGVVAEASALEYKGKNGCVDYEFKVLGGKLGAEAEAGTQGVGANAEARLKLFEGAAAGIGIRLGVGVSTGGSVGNGGLDVKVLGCGFSIGKTTSIRAFDNELAVDVPKLVNTFKGLFRKFF